MIRYESCLHSDVQTFSHYLASLSSPMDSFLEGHILESAFHRILLDSEEVGSFAMHKNFLLTQFHLLPKVRRFGQPVFADILRRFGVTSAFVPTFDEFFLSHALDVEGRIEKQACFFQESPCMPQPPEIFSRLVYRQADASDMAQVRAINGGLMDDPEAWLARGRLHVGFLDEEMVALGLIEESRLLTRHVSLGVGTKESRRRLGIGTCTILYLRNVCREQEITPVAGCWYYNHASKATLEAAGMITPTRLLRFEFVSQA